MKIVETTTSATKCIIQNRGIDDPNLLKNQVGTLNLELQLYYLICGLQYIAYVRVV